VAFSAPDTGETAASRERPEPGTEPARTPLLAVLGAGDAAVTAVARAVADARTRAAASRETVAQRVTEVPAELRGRFSAEELFRALDAYRAQAGRAYAEFAERGEQAWGRLREQPQMRQAITTLEAYTERLDVRVDDLVDDAEKALTVVGRQTGERVARAGQRFTGRAADAVVDAGAEASDAVADASTAAAGAIEDAGEEAAAATEKATEKAAGQTTGQTTGKAPRSAAPKPATRRTGGPGAG